MSKSMQKRVAVQQRAREALVRARVLDLLRLSSAAQESLRREATGDLPIDERWFAVLVEDMIDDGLIARMADGRLERVL